MNRSQKICRDLLIAYALLMLWLLFGQRIGPGLWESYPQRLAENFNLIPFSTLADFTDTLREGIKQLKQYERPIVEYVKFSARDVVCASALHTPSETTTKDPYQTPRIGI